jgi:hypothetical protein
LTLLRAALTRTDNITRRDRQPIGFAAFWGLNSAVRGYATPTMLARLPRSWLCSAVS